MTELQPDHTDAILGGQNSQPVNALVLGGGIAGAKLQIANEWGMSYELVDRLSKTHKVFSFETVKTNDIGEIVKRVKRHAFYYIENLENDVILDMVYIPAGSFMMGSPQDISNSDVSEGKLSTERPQHLVMIPAFYMAKYPTTQEQYQAIILKNPSNFKGNKRPVEQVSGFEAKQYCQNLMRRTKKSYILPSESQWEYACRSGTNTLFYCGDTISNDLANYHKKFCYKNYPSGLNRPQTTEVDKFHPNNFGLYDVHGNVLEWCTGNWHENYQNAPTDERPWMNVSSHPGYDSMYPHVLRGGSWCVESDDCRSASRTSGFQIPSHVGFRVACLAD